MSSEPEPPKDVDTTTPKNSTSPTVPVTGKGPNRVDIVGEQVDLTDGSDKAMAPMIVNFTDYYVPGDMTSSDKEKLRNAIKQVFTNKNEPPPPCNASDKDIIIKGLEWRLTKLREKRNAASKIKDTAAIRSTIDHTRRLCAFIDKFKKADCNDQGLVYNESGLGELTDSSIDTLLKQFIFVLLQAHLPIEDYKQFTQQAKDIVQKIGRMPSDLEEIILKFNGKIPSRIKELINCMKLVPLNVIEQMVQDEIKLLLVRIMERLKTVIDKDDPFWKVIGSQPTIESIVDALLTKINESKTGITPGQDTQIQVLTTEVERLKGLLESLQANNTELLAQIAQLEEEIKKLRASVGKDVDPTLLGQLQAKNAELERLLEELKQENNSYKAKLLLTLTPEQIAELQGKLDSLQAEYDKLLELNKNQAGLRKGLEDKIRELETKTTGDPSLANANKLLKEALEQLQNKNTTLENLIKTLEGQVADLQRKYDAKVKEIEDELKELEKELHSTSTTEATTVTNDDPVLKELREKNNELEALLVKLKEQHEAELAPLKAEIIGLKAQNATYEEQMKELKKLNTQLQAEIDRLTSLLAAKEAESAGVEKAKKALEDEKADLLTRLAELSSEISGLKERISELSNAYTQTKADLESKLAGKQAEIDTLKTGSTVSQAEQAELQGKLAELSEEAKTLKNTISELAEKYATEKADLERQLAERAAEVNALKTSLAEAQEQLELLRNEVKELKNRLEELKQEYTATQKALDDAMKEFESVDTILVKIMEDFDGMKGEKDSEIADLNEKLKACLEKSTELTKLTAEKTALEARLGSVTEEKDAEIVRLKAEIARLTGELGSKNTSASAAEAKAAAAEARAAAAEKGSADEKAARAEADRLRDEAQKERDAVKAELAKALADATSAASAADKKLKDAEAAATAAASKGEGDQQAAAAALQAARDEAAKANAAAAAAAAEAAASATVAAEGKAGAEEAAAAATAAKELADAATAAAAEREKVANQRAAAAEAAAAAAAQGQGDQAAAAAALALAMKEKDAAMKAAQDLAAQQLTAAQTAAAAAAERAEKAEAGSSAERAAKEAAEAAAALAKAEAEAATRRANEAEALAKKAAEIGIATGATAAQQAKIAAAEARATIAAANADAARKIAEAQAAAAGVAELAEAAKKAAILRAEIAEEAAEAAADKLAAAAKDMAEQHARELEELRDELKEAADKARADAAAIATKEAKIAELQVKLDACLNRDALKAIILAFSNSSKQATPFTLEDGNDPDLNNLMQLIREQIQNRNNWHERYKSMQEGIQAIAANMNKPDWTGEDITNKDLKALVTSIQALKESKVPTVIQEQQLTQFCYLLFFTSHILSTHFPAGDNDKMSKALYNSVVDINLDNLKYFKDLTSVLNILMPILNIMEQIYQSGIPGEFKLNPIEFTTEGAHLFELLLNKLTGELDPSKILPHFSKKTGSTDISPLSKVYIVVNYKDKKILDGYSIINNQRTSQGGLFLVDTPSLNKKLPYSEITTILQNELVKTKLDYKTDEPSLSKEKKLSYPVLFYFLMFTFKKFLNTRQGKLQGTQCHLPKIFRA